MFAGGTLLAHAASLHSSELPLAAIKHWTVE
jgi:hypothetical protein